MADMREKGRGHFNPNGHSEPWRRAKLTYADVVEIRSRAAGGESRRSLCESFGMSKDAIRQVVLHQTWTHIP